MSGGATGVGGRWACTVASPMGAQDFILTVTPDGDRFSGRAEGGLGAMDIADGTIDGARLAWPMRVEKPMKVTLNCKAEVDGDTLAGTVSAGIFGSFPISGRRA